MLIFVIIVCALLICHCIAVSDRNRAIEEQKRIEAIENAEHQRRLDKIFG